MCDKLYRFPTFLLIPRQCENHIFVNQFQDFFQYCILTRQIPSLFSMSNFFETDSDTIKNGKVSKPKRHTLPPPPSFETCNHVIMCLCEQIWNGSHVSTWNGGTEPIQWKVQLTKCLWGKHAKQVWTRKSRKNKLFLRSTFDNFFFKRKFQRHIYGSSTAMNVRMSIWEVWIWKVFAWESRW